MFSNMELKNLLPAALIGIVFFALVLGCGGGLTGQKTCTGEIVYEGQTFRGMDREPEQARKNTCSKYCIEGDPEYDALYRIWLESPKAKKTVKPDKWAAMSEDKSLFRYVEKCTEKCLDDYRAGKRRIEVKCR